MDTPPTRDLAKSLSSDIFSTLVLGNKIFVGSVLAQGKPFVFSPDQAAFLITLQKLKSITAAAIAVDKTEEWATKFFSSKKFVTFRNLKLDEAKVKAGLTLEYLMLLAKWNLEGEKVIWSATCAVCHYTDQWTEYQVEASRDDEMQLKPECPFCFNNVVLEEKPEPFSMNREQMDHWKELAARFWPKIERVAHTFSTEEIEFKTGD